MDGKARYSTHILYRNMKEKSRETFLYISQQMLYLYNFFIIRVCKNCFATYK